MISHIAPAARRCIKEADEATGPLGADSSAAETTRYEYVERPNREERDFVETHQKTYWKYHITAILGICLQSSDPGSCGTGSCCTWADSINHLPAGLHITVSRILENR